MTRARTALVIVSAAAYAASLPPLGWRWLAWVALVPCFAAVRTATPARAAWLGLLWGVALAFGTAWWLPGMIAAYLDTNLWIGWLGLVVVGVAHAGVAYAPAAAWIAWTARRRAGGPLAIAAAWCAAELVRTSLLGDPWALAGYTQVGWPALLQVADLGGVVAVSFVVVAMNATLATRPLRARHLAAALLLVAAALGYGGHRLDEAPPGARAPIPVGVVQSGVGRDFRWREEYRRIGVDEHLGPSVRLRDAGTALLVWPEHAVSFYVQEAAPEATRLRDGLASLAADVVLGAPHYERGIAGDTVYHNSVFLLRDGRLAGRYDKRRLLPLAETTGRTPYTPGRDPAILSARGARLGALVCFEAMFPALARSAVVAGAEVLVNVTNDSWFGSAAAARQHLEMAAVRAVETRRWLVRAAATGHSAIVDPWGRIVAISPLDEAATLRAPVVPRDDASPYVRAGDAPILGLVLVLLATATATALRAGLTNRRAAS